MEIFLNSTQENEIPQHWFSYSQTQNLAKSVKNVADGFPWYAGYLGWVVAQGDVVVIVLKQFTYKLKNM
jgi:hypothetical protein